MSEADNKPESLDELDNPLEASLVYSRYLGRTLQQRAEDMNTARLKLVGLTEELAVMRLIACEALASYGQLLDSPPANLTAGQLQGLRVLASAQVIESLNQVRDMAVSASRIINKEALDPVTAQTLIFQLIKVVDNEFQDLAPRLQEAGLDASKIVDALQTKLLEVRPPDPKVSMGTSLTPETIDDEIREMYNTVPNAPHGMALVADPRVDAHRSNGHVA